MHSSGIDLIIFIGFFILYFVANFFYRTKLTSVDDYNDPNRNFSTTKIAATLIAIWIGSGFIFYTFIESYKQGLYLIIPSLFIPASLLFISYFISPRVNEFLGKSSISEITKELWGRWVAFFTVMSYILMALGMITAKFQFAAQLLTIFFNISYDLGVIIGATIIITYSLLARIKIAVFSDVIQFTMFSCILPITLLIAWKGFSNTEVVWHTLNSNPKFNLNHVFDTHNSNFYRMLGLCLFAFIPKFGPLVFQNIAMSKTLQQSAAAFKISGMIFLILQLVTVFLVTVILSDNPNINSNDLFRYCVNNYTYTGLKGVICICSLVLALCITDFLLLTSSSMLARDVFKPAGFKWAKNESLIFRYFTIIAGIIAIYLAFTTTETLSLLVGFSSFMMTLVSIPILFAIFGFRSSSLSVLIGMASSVVSMILYQYKFAIPGIDFFIPGILTNVIFLFGSHYLLKQPKGWVGIKGVREFAEFKQEKTRAQKQFIHDTFGLSFLDFCKQGLPASAANISFFGLFSLVSIFLNQISLPETIACRCNEFIHFIYPSAFIIGINLVFYPIWPNTLKQEYFVSVVWLLSVLYISIVIPAIFAFISNFLPMQLIIALINFIAIFVMLKWNITLFLILTGMIAASLYLYYCVDYINAENLQLQISYLLLFLGGTLIAFLKPYKQNNNDQNSKLLLSNVSRELQNISEQTLNLLILKQDLINNLNQEVKAPIENIGVGATTLHQNRNHLTGQVKDSAELVYREYRKLQGYTNKLIDLSKLNTGNIALDYQDVNFQELVENVIDPCRNCELKNPDLHFEINVQAKQLIITCDPFKISQCLGYLIKNARNFSQKGTIEVLLENQEMVINEKLTPMIKCSVIDEGIGIPEDELQHIFGPFTQSSYTKGTTSGKGLGLALCQRIIELHHGIIWAENNKAKPGATFSFIIPIRKTDLIDL